MGEKEIYQNKRLQLYKSTLKFPWVFFIKIVITKGFFKGYSSVRKANCKEYRLSIFKVYIGKSWLEKVLLAHITDFGHLNFALKTNKRALKQNYFSFQIGKYSKID